MAAIASARACCSAAISAVGCLGVGDALGAWLCPEATRTGQSGHLLHQALDGPLGLLLRCLLQVCPTGLSLPGCIHLLQEVSGIPGPTVSINLLDGVLAWSHHHNLSMILHLASLVGFSRE